MDQKHKARYRRLTDSELQSLEKEFVDFLASQSITAPDWEKMKTEAVERAHSLIDVFSDIVLQKVLEKIDLLELRAKHELLFVDCRTDKMIMIGMQIEGGAIDLTTELSRQSLESLVSSSETRMQLVSAEKIYRKSREEEVFQMLQSKYLISKNVILFERLKALHQGAEPTEVE